MALKELLDRNGITPRDLALGSGLSLSGVYEILAGKRNPTTVTVGAILGFLTSRTGRRVTYEDVWGTPSAISPEAQAS